jgi:hypothetical protein
LNYFCPNDSIHRASNELNTGIIVIETRIKEEWVVFNAPREGKRRGEERGKKKRKKKNIKRKDKKKTK